VAGIGLQIGVIFLAGAMQGHLNFKAYAEFDAADRPSGWNAWVTFVVSWSYHSGHAALAGHEIMRSFSRKSFQVASC
jgi:hypothetical protein